MNDKEKRKHEFFSCMCMVVELSGVFLLFTSGQVPVIRSKQVLYFLFHPVPKQITVIWPFGHYGRMLFIIGLNINLVEKDNFMNVSSNILFF